MPIKVTWAYRQFCFDETHDNSPSYSLTYWGRDKMAAIFQTTFPNAFFLNEMYEFRIRFHWNMFLRVKLTISQHWLVPNIRQAIIWINTDWMDWLTHICVTWPDELLEECQLVYMLAIDKYQIGCSRGSWSLCYQELRLHYIIRGKVW